VIDYEPREEDRENLPGAGSDADEHEADDFEDRIAAERSADGADTETEFEWSGD
jgi:hypothetical protein